MGLCVSVFSIRSSVLLASPQLLGLTGGDMSTYGGSCCSPNILYEQHFALNCNQKSDFGGCNISDWFNSFLGVYYALINNKGRWITYCCM